MIHTLSRQHLVLLCAVQASVLLPVFFTLPLGFAFYWAAVAIWRVYSHHNVLPLQNRLIKISAILLGFLALFFSFTQFLSIETFVAFFLVSYSLKLVELYQKRDATLLLSLSFIAIAVGFLFNQSVWVAVHAIFCFFLIVQVWITLQRSGRRAVFADLKFSASIVAFVLPVMVVLFLVMPRLGPIWHMPSHSQVGSTGFSSTMSLGTFSQLIQSDKVAFRVTFEQEDIPPLDARYWRGLVLDFFDGKEWSRGSSFRDSLYLRQSTQTRPSNWHIDIDDSIKPFRYSVLLEPHFQKSLFTLMAPDSASSRSLRLNFASDGLLQARLPVASRTQYSVISYLSYQFSADEISAKAFQYNIRIPKNGNTQSQLWAQSLREKHGIGATSDREIANEILQYFNRDFTYTLQPPLMEENAVDAFLFNEKRGFCEHFAGSFVYLLRAAGIPARVVVGYQGGEYNEALNYIVVRQRDAHAWAELWLEGEGWLRVDPTAAVAPERIERGLSEAVDASERASVGGLSSNVLWINWVQGRLEVFNYRWQMAVVNYDQEMQSFFFQFFLGGKQLWRVAAFLIGAVGFVLLVYFALQRVSNRRRFKYRESQIYQQHLNQLARRGFKKSEGESPLMFAERVASVKPEWADDLRCIAELFQRVAFGGEQDVLARLEAACKRWRA